MHAQPAGERGAIVRSDEVRPLADRERLAHAHARGRSRPEVDRAPAQVAVHELELDAGRIGILRVEARRMQERGPRVALSGPNPQRDADLVVAAEARQAVEREAAVSIEARRTARASFAQLELAELLRSMAVEARRWRARDQVGHPSVLDRLEIVVRIRRRSLRGARGESYRLHAPLGLCTLAVDLGLRELHRAPQLAFAPQLLVRREPHEGRRRVDGERVGLEPVLVDRAKHRRERVELARRDRVVLVVVASRALERESEEGRAEGADAVGDAFLPELLGDRAAFLRHAVQPVKAGRHAIVDARLGLKVARDDRTDEAVVGHVRRERVQQPVAPRPGERVAVGLVAVRIGVAREIEPHGGHVLGRARRGEHRVDAARVLRIARIRCEGVGLFGRRRQAREHERGPAQQDAWIGLGFRSEAAALDCSEYVGIELVARPVL